MLRNIVKYTLGLPVLLIYTILCLFIELCHFVIQNIIVNSCSYILTGKGQYEDALFLQDISNVWKPIIKENVPYEIGKDKIVYILKKYYLPFHIRIVYHGKRIEKKYGYTLIDFTFYEYSRKVLRNGLLI